jgi:hypothetical protein
LPGERLLVADGTSALKVFDRGGRIVQRVRLARWAAALDIERETGDILVGESGGYEKFDARRRRQWFRPLESRVSCIQHLPNNEVLLCEPDAHRVSNVDARGSIVWAVSNLDYAWRAVYVP